MKNPVHLQHIGVTAVMGSEDFSGAVRPNCNLTARQHIPGGSDGTKWMDFIWRLNDKHNCNFSCGWKEIRDLRQGAAEKMVCRSDWWKILEVTPARLTSPDFFFWKPKSNIDKNPKLQLLWFGWIRANIVGKIEEKKDKTKNHSGWFSTPLTYSVLPQNRQLVAVWFHLSGGLILAQVSLTHGGERKHTRVAEMKSPVEHFRGIYWRNIELKYMCLCSGKK